MNYRNAPHAEILELTRQACSVAQQAARSAGDLLRSGSEPAATAISEREQQLDELDREIDERVTASIAAVPPSATRDLLTCTKFIVELERIGDLLLAFARRAQAMGARLRSNDANDLLGMTAVLERMLEEACTALDERNVQRALGVLSSDAEIDRLRNLLFARHIEEPAAEPRADSIHVIAMAQALERAGDHTKNLAEEIVHLVTGRSVRHILPQKGKSYEEMYIDWIRQQQRRVS